MDLSIYLDKDRASQKLTNFLSEGQLTLFLGSGASAGLGLPQWHELINNLEKELQLFKNPGFDIDSYKEIVSKDTEANILQDEADRIKRKFGAERNFMDAFEKALYPNRINFNDIGKILHNELLMAIGALMIGSKRGSVKNIISLNYDSILEWYASIYGYVTNVIYDLPALEGNEDIRVYHPHGFIPHPDFGMKRSTFSILGLNSVCDRLGNKDDIWFDKTRQLMRSGICLFIGMSERTYKDPAIRTVINSFFPEVKDKRPIGFWILVGDEDKFDIEGFLEKNIIPIVFKDKNEIPNFLFNLINKK